VFFAAQLVEIAVNDAHMISYICKISGIYGGDYEESSLLGCGAV
jgi:hypothetical protein